MKNGCSIVWKHWRDAYSHDRSMGIRTFPRLTDDHFDLSPASRMRNHLADEVLCPRMAEIMTVSKIGYAPSVPLWTNEHFIQHLATGITEMVSAPLSLTTKTT